MYNTWRNGLISSNTHYVFLCFLSATGQDKCCILYGDTEARSLIRIQIQINKHKNPLHATQWTFF